jgi:hypothetical protein
VSAGIRRCLAAWLVALSSPACSTPSPGELQPRDFAYGLTVASSAGEPFFRVAVPDYVFGETAWADLRDLRVFNAAAEPVPFARLTPPAASQTRRVPLRSFRLQSAQPGGLPQIQVHAGGQGVELRMAPAATPETGAEYLLALPEADDSTSFERLHLDWLQRRENWQQQVTVAVSRDLQSWTTVADGRPIMDLETDDGQRLKHPEVALDRSAARSGRYWRLRFNPGFSPRLTSVEGEVRAETPAPPGVRLTTSIEPQADRSVVVRLRAPHPVSQLRITPDEINSVLPIQVDGRESASGAWQPLARTVAYRLNAGGGEQRSDAVRLNGRLLQAIRLRPIGPAWGAQAPRVDVEREPVVLVVNARGAGPFLLAWGSRAAEDTSVPVATLVPRRTSGEPIPLPEGRMMARRELGGESRLTALAPSERAARWQTTLVWVALVGGALVLGGLAVHVWREGTTGGIDELTN